MKRLLILAMAAAFAAWAVWASMQPANAPQGGVPKLLPPAPAQVHAIIISQGKDSQVRIERHDGEWFVAGDNLSPANTEYVSRLLSDITAMRVVRVVTRKRDHDVSLGFGDHVSGVELLDASGNVLFDVHVGKQGSDVMSTYIRIQGQDPVLAVDKSLIWQLKRDASAWKAPKPADKQEPPAPAEKENSGPSPEADKSPAS
jgi:hypothetical protein